MKLENLVHMANRIGEFFAAMPDRDEARDGIANHIKRYWEPRMRKVLVDHLEEARGLGLNESVARAIHDKREMLQVR
jgi:formate dehydrogenase subunit delta